MTDNTVEINIVGKSASVEDATKKAEDALKRLNDQVKGNTEGLAPLNTASRAVFEQYDKGLATLTSAQNAFGHVTEALQKNEISATQAARMLAQIEAQAAGAAHGMVDLGLSASSAANGARALIDELSAGRMRQATGTFTRLFLTVAEANPILAGATAAVLAFGGALGYVLVEAYETNKAVADVYGTMLLTGRGADFSSERVRQFVEELHKLPEVSAASARGVVIEIEKIPVATDKTRESLLQLSVALASLSGTKPEEAAKELAKAFAGGATALLSFGRQYNLFTQEQIDGIKSAERAGDVYKAQQIAIDALNERALKPYVGYLEQVKKYNEEMKAFSLAQGLDPTGGSAINPLPPPTPPSMGKGAQAEDPEHARQIASEERYLGVLRQRQAIEADIDQIEKRLAGTLSEKERAEAEEALTAAKARLDSLKDQGDASRVQEWKSELQAKDAATDQSRQSELRNDISYWQEILDHQRLTGKERVEIENEVSRAKTELHREESAAIIAEDRAKLESSRQSGQQRLLDVQKLVDDSKRLYGEDSTNYQNALRTKEQITREVNEQIRADNLQLLESQRQAALGEVDELREKARVREALSFEGAHQETELRLQAADRQYQIDLDYLTREQALYDRGTKEYDQYTRKIETLARTHNAQRTKIEDDALIQSQRNWQRTFSQITSGFGNAITGMLLRTTTFQQAEVQVAQSVLNAFVQMGGKIVANWAATEVAQMLISQDGVAKRIGVWLAGIATQDAAKETSNATQAASDVALAAESATASATAARLAIGAYAAEAAVAAMASVAAIPFVGWAMAPGVGIETYAEGLSYEAAVPGLAVGAYDVPQDMTARIHKDEMVVPATFAEGIRSVMAGATGGSSSGGDTHIHIHAIDAQSLTDRMHTIAPVLTRIVNGYNRNNPSGAPSP